MSKAKLPTREECFDLLKEYKVPENIIQHTLLVTKIAVFLAKKLKETGLDIDVDLVDRASLVHDLDKIQTLNTGQHGIMTEEILTKRDYSLVGKIAMQHKFGTIHDPTLSWEAKIVNYADKRVAHDKLVSLKERIDEAWERYKHKYKKRDLEALRLFIKLEEDIFSRIKLKPEDLEKYLK